MAAAVALDELLILPRFGVLFGAQEQHVFQKVGQTFPVLGVIAAADAYVQGGGRLIGGGVGHQDGPQAIVQFQITVFVGVVRAFDGLLGG